MRGVLNMPYISNTPYDPNVPCDEECIGYTSMKITPKKGYTIVVKDEDSLDELLGLSTLVGSLVCINTRQLEDGYWQVEIEILE